MALPLYEIYIRMDMAEYSFLNKTDNKKERK